MGVLAHCWVLGQQDRPLPAVLLHAFGCVVGVWEVVDPGGSPLGGLVLVPAALKHHVGALLWGGVGGVGVWCGLLFGNCIVDASILFLLSSHTAPWWCVVAPRM